MYKKVKLWVMSRSRATKLAQFYSLYAEGIRNRLGGLTMTYSVVCSARPAGT